MKNNETNIFTFSHQKYVLFFNQLKITLKIARGKK